MMVLTKTEAAAYLRVSRRTLDRFRAAKLLPSFKVGGVVRFRREDLDQLVARFSTAVPQDCPNERGNNHGTV
jgi:excisionase family DNA binding protein